MIFRKLTSWLCLNIRPGSKAQRVSFLGTVVFDHNVMTIEFYQIEFDFECEWSEYDKEHDLDSPWMCDMPYIIGYTAVSVSIALMSFTFYR